MQEDFLRDSTIHKAGADIFMNCISSSFVKINDLRYFDGLINDNINHLFYQNAEMSYQNIWYESVAY